MTSHRSVVAGGAGFLGSHLCDALIERGDEVLCVDNCSTGSTDNISHLNDHERFTFLHHDVVQPGLAEQVETLWPDQGPTRVLNLASPASPPEYLRRPIDTLDVGSIGTRRLLDLALQYQARFFLASTSEVYGDPLVHPQPESYWGNVNPIGERSVYDEAKRFAEAITMAYHRTHGLDVRIVRIFNTYGPRMQADDGRVVTNFVNQALQGAPITIYGDGSQTRSFCYVDDEVRGLLALLDGPVHPRQFIEPLRSDPVRRRALLTLCLIYGVCAMSILILADGLSGSAWGRLQQLLPKGEAAQAEIDALLAEPGVGTAVMLGLALGALLSVPFWHAPALVHWGGQGVRQALFSSTVAVWRSKGAFLAYGLAWLGVMLLFGVLAAVVFAVLGVPQMAGALGVPGGLVFSAVFYLSVLFTFNDSFGAGPPPPETPQEAPEDAPEEAPNESTPPRLPD